MSAREILLVDSDSEGRNQMAESFRQEGIFYHALKPSGRDDEEEIKMSDL